MNDLNQIIAEISKYTHNPCMFTKEQKILKKWVAQLKALNNTNIPVLKEITISGYYSINKMEELGYVTSLFSLAVGALMLDVAYEDSKCNWDEQIIIWGKELETRTLANQIIYYINVAKLATGGIK